MSNYSKHKERLPQDTVFEIQRILDKMGLATTLTWTPELYDGVCSNRVTIHQTSFGSNGKGTDRDYAAASAYAELIERIQNDMLAYRPKWPQLQGDEPFLTQPDERIMSIDELVAQHDPFLATLAGQLNLIVEDDLKAFLKNASETYEQRDDGTLLSVPYVDLAGNRVVWIPEVLVRVLYGSNGMAAGNTMEEALVQAISELFERHVNKLLLQGTCVPPEIPDEALRPFSIWNVIEQIRSDERYDVTVLDCSLGKGFPVVGTHITDLEHGTFCMRLGAHPSLAVAVERTLTELFQGWDRLEGAASLCTVGSSEEAASYHNIPNVAKIGMGVYPARLFTDEPDWAFTPWSEWEGLDNRGFLAKLLDILAREGVNVLVRDVSHLGFPSCRVVIPGWSEMYPLSPLRFRSANTASRNTASFGHFPDYTPEEERRLLTIIRIKEQAIMENMIGAMTQRGLTNNRMSTDRIGSFLSLNAGKYDMARHFFRKLSSICEDRDEQLYLRCITDMVRFREMGMDEDQVYMLLYHLYRKDVASRVEEETRDPETMLQKVFPRLSCFECDKCELAGTECLQPQEREVMGLVRTAMAQSHVSQTQLLSNLREVQGTLT